MTNSKAITTFSNSNKNMEYQKLANSYFYLSLNASSVVFNLREFLSIGQISGQPSIKVFIIRLLSSHLYFSSFIQKSHDAQIKILVLFIAILSVVLSTTQ